VPFTDWFFQNPSAESSVDDPLVDFFERNLRGRVKPFTHATGEFLVAEKIKHPHTQKNGI
jgi:hypothetical protein